MSINVDGTFFVSRAAVPVMRRRGGGVIVNISSTCGLVGSAALVAYCASKGAVTNLTRAMALDHASEGIRVNAISAGPIKTLAASGIGDFRYIMKWNEYNSPLRRNVTTEDVGKAALFLLSDLGSGTTGENLHVDAGYHVVGMKAVDAPDIEKT